jgi:malonyl-CoA O-methyltransferase
LSRLEIVPKVSRSVAAPDGFRIDQSAARRAFARVASLDPKQDVERRMAERLELVKLAPQRVLDAGSGAGASSESLRRRFPRAELYDVDVTLGALRGPGQPFTARAMNWVRGVVPSRSICADLSVLPLRPASINMIWSNLALNWASDLPATLQEWNRVLAIEGLLTFSCYGPDTLRELRSAGAGVHDFVDMHDLGDMLVNAGFAEPVMDMERITLTYADVRALVRDLRATGQVNVLAARRRGLRGRTYWREIEACYEAHRQISNEKQVGRLPATIEIVYGHAWKVASRVREDGRAIVNFDPGFSRSRRT